METETIKPTAELLAEKYGITVKSTFVPFSKSRNKDEDHKTLNWIVELQVNGRTICKTDYSAGEAHCPSYKQLWNAKAFQKNSQLVKIAFEVEKGIEAEAAVCDRQGGLRAQPKKVTQSVGREYTPSKTIPILPDPVGVVWSLVQDADVLNAGSFEEWACNYGYDMDSRSAEATYRACLDIALQLRNGLGEGILSELGELFADY